MRKFVFAVVAILIACNALFAQINNQIGTIVYDETLFYAEVKQVNQFFRRFNNEEDPMGLRYSTNAPEYRDNKVRKSYFISLFDRHNASIPDNLKNQFIQTVTDDKNPLFLDFYGQEWYAELATQLLWNGQQRMVMLYLKLEKEHQGYKWVISNVEIPEYNNIYKEVTDEERTGLFLHPMSHEIDFMNMYKAFQNSDKMACYVGKDFRPNHLTLFIDALNKQNILFVSVNNVKFHFMQIEGWWFEISYLNRSDVNSGWLITNLLKIDTENYKALKRTFDYEY
ncbi:MAG: hypothetical protein LBH92_06245 [Bacteroidales bacterium]|jgi:hypothetical protein|nr:hypothetical protein [Bacteroidales bacterium]